MPVRHLTSREVAEEMGCTMETARARMRQMVHTVSPLTVTEYELRRWWTARTRLPDKKTKYTYPCKERR